MSSTYSNSFSIGGIYKAVLLSEQQEGVQVFIPELWNDDSTNPINPDGSVNQAIYQKYKSIYPVCNWCAPNIGALIHETGDTCWVIFDTGEINKPTIVGYAGLSIKTISVGSNPNGGSSSSSSGSFGGYSSSSNYLVNSGLTEYSKYLWIGDSRTVQMKAAINRNSIDSSKDAWVCKGAMGIDWIKESEQETAINNNIVTGTAIIFQMGVNDVNLNKVNEYIEYLNEHIPEWGSKGANTYFVSVNPVEDGHGLSNDNITKFNRTIISDVKNINYIDVSSHINFKYNDWLHYMDETYVAWYNYVKSNIKPAGNTVITGSAMAQQILTEAQKYLGTPYVWGGESPSGFDCSGFTQYVFGQLGISISRVADDQFNGKGQFISSMNDLQTGDLVFFGDNKYANHVGIYAGNGKMIHAPHTGDVVKFTDIVNSSYYTGRFLGGRRIV